MIPDTISDIFQPMNDCFDFFYGLDVEIRPKLTPGAGTPRWALAAIHPGWGNRYFCIRVAMSHARPCIDFLSHVMPHQRVWCQVSEHVSSEWTFLVSGQSKIPIPPPRVDSSKGQQNCNFFESWATFWDP